MFPITHIYCIKKILNSNEQNADLFLGSVFPDIGIAGILNRMLTHYNGKEMYNFFLEKYPNHLDFAKGYICHGSKPKGIDYYCDENPTPRNGYAFDNSAHLIEDVKNYSGLNDMMSLVRAHNFVELAVEILLVKKFPDLKSDLEYTKKNYNKELLNILSIFYNISESDIEVALGKYFGLIVDPSSIESASFGFNETFKFKDKVDMGKDKIQLILNNAIKKIESNFIYELDIMINHTNENMIGLIG